MRISSGESLRDRLAPALLLAGRIALGGGLGLVFTMFSIVVAWGLFLFSGSQSLAIWSVSLMFSAGLGAGAGNLLAWMGFDRRNNRAQFATAVLVVAAGTLGAWLGYIYGSNREIECCAMPTTSPVYYTALGATLGASVAVLTNSLSRKFLERRVGTRIPKGIP